MNWNQQSQQNRREQVLAQLSDRLIAIWIQRMPLSEALDSGLMKLLAGGDSAIEREMHRLCQNQGDLSIPLSQQETLIRGLFALAGMEVKP